jgi:hypothetical protein
MKINNIQQIDHRTIRLKESIKEIVNNDFCEVCQNESELQHDKFELMKEFILLVQLYKFVFIGILSSFLESEILISGALSMMFIFWFIRTNIKKKNRRNQARDKNTQAHKQEKYNI